MSPDLSPTDRLQHLLFMGHKHLVSTLETMHETGEPPSDPHAVLYGSDGINLHSIVGVDTGLVQARFDDILTEAGDGCSGGALIFDALGMTPSGTSVDALHLVLRPADQAFRIYCSLPYGIRNGQLHHPAPPQIYLDGEIPGGLREEDVLDVLMPRSDGQAWEPSNGDAAGTSPDEDRGLVPIAPLAAFIWIARAGGGLRQKEMTTFLKGLGGAEGRTIIWFDSTLRLMKHAGPGKLLAHWLTEDDATVEAAIVEGVEAWKRITGDDAAQDREALYDLMHRVVRASGSWFRRIDPRKQQALTVLRALLDLDG